MNRTELFEIDGFQAVSLGADVAFPPEIHEVSIIRDGPRRIIVPSNALWDDFFDSPGVDLGERDQPTCPAREHPEEPC